MAPYPDGDALSERELRILERIERDIEATSVEILDDGFLARDPVPFQLCAIYLLVAEVALAFAAYASMTALATIGSAIFPMIIVQSVRGTRVS